MWTVIDSTPSIAEKPYIIMDGGKYYIMVPPVETNKVGYSKDWTAGTRVDFSDVYVAVATDSAATINKYLSDGLHVVLSPGIYNLSEPLMVTHEN